MAQDGSVRESRRRSRLACDECARSRVKCHGTQPCRRCQENGHECLYDRDIRKRGRKRVSRRHEDDPTGQQETTHVALSTQHTRHDQDLQTIRSGQVFEPSLTAPAEALDTREEASDRVASARPSVSSIIQSNSPFISASTALPVDISSSETANTTVRSGHMRPGEQTVQTVLLQSPPVPKDQYACLEPLYSQLDGIIRPQLACELLELYFAPSDGNSFRNASPYVITPVLRKESVLNPTCARPTTTALLATMIWVSAQTASLPQLLLPGSRAELCDKLQILVFQLQHERDQENWQKISGRFVRRTRAGPSPSNSNTWEEMRPPPPVIDDVLSLILITIVISGGDFKTDCLPWWNKALRLLEVMGLHRLDLPDARWDSDAVTGLERNDDTYRRLHPIEAKEEMRRTFWLAFALDRHLALSFNGNLSIVDGEHFVYSPLPEQVWGALDQRSLDQLPIRERGPSALVSGTGFFEFFLPLMVLLGDIIHLRRRRNHPHFGNIDHRGSVAMIEELLDRCKDSIDKVKSQGISRINPNSAFASSSFDLTDQPALQETAHRWSCTSPTSFQSYCHARQNPNILLVTSYSYFILHVLHILLHGEWDALTMLAWSPPTSSHNNWMTSTSFLKCSSHAILASEAVAFILDVDPELSFMPYLVGIYLFHGSLVLLLFADRMPAVQGGPNHAVESACETIIRAHEACIVTLSTEFQRVFKRVMRATLTVVRNQNQKGWWKEIAQTKMGDFDGQSTDVVKETVADMRKDMLSLYRWSCGERGLAI
ncbi:hypothetical protein BKA66DRAFT_600746 [Pyrenochaeta sp. MPI-SDFR-AT-0127]|nr:hypothetical protein BKA66DRAFT_600746 [Pyrenochaeta sp. MPI-SDFR-AT-0127]